jgi:hypothetical protein
MVFMVHGQLSIGWRWWMFSVTMHQQNGRKYCLKNQELVHEDCFQTMHELTDSVGISYCICQTLTENLTCTALPRSLFPNSWWIITSIGTFVTNISNLVILPHPPYLLDLAQCGFALLPKLKMNLQGWYSKTVSLDRVSASKGIHTNSGCGDHSLSMLRQQGICMDRKQEEAERPTVWMHSPSLVSLWFLLLAICTLDMFGGAASMHLELAQDFFLSLYLVFGWQLTSRNMSSSPVMYVYWFQWICKVCSLYVYFLILIKMKNDVWWSHKSCHTSNRDSLV